MVDTPWRSLLPSDGGREYLALLSYLPLKGFRKMLTLQRQTGKVRAQLASTPGLVGYSFRAKLMSHRFWTLSIWEVRAGADGLRRERSAPRHDGHPRAVHGRDRVHSMDDPRFRRPALVGRGDAASRRDVHEVKDRQAVEACLRVLTGKSHATCTLRRRGRSPPCTRPVACRLSSLLACPRRG